MTCKSGRPLLTHMNQGVGYHKRNTQLLRPTHQTSSLRPLLLGARPLPHYWPTTRGNVKQLGDLYTSVTLHMNKNYTIRMHLFSDLSMSYRITF